ncbi:flagellar export chaperone FliS [[Clostridium] colinum]|uniref:flagellar export chaperone FliS n=1 Tax=[Clostridium] colinum TaxID=36835 RepID=UPI00202415EC|nr:flagellar protein FliS [[Clostridium] colinum]
MGINKEEYVAKISKASPLKLVIINFEIIFDYLEQSKLTIDDDKKFDFNISKAREFLLELRCSLDMQYEISSYLLTLYNYSDRQLAKFLFSKNLEDLNSATVVLKKLMSAFEQIEDNEKDKTPIMENTDTIYAGLTYGKNGQLQEFVDTKQNKGFKA